ncbi:hypothetical protein [Mesobacterium pallidum]|uniref:hypothetical protein n=1 Tax=Mesobacterium pallidum TaxID=2872037 RepID=UPI001EE1627B|nr:hypothetical protein [Mesobacterium pallidum]
MSTYVSKEVQAGIDAARRTAKRAAARLRVKTGTDKVYPILRIWDTGFALDAEDAPELRGLVDIYDGARHLRQCLIIASAEAGGEVICDFKRATESHDQPPRDFAVDPAAPVALIGRESSARQL